MLNNTPYTYTELRMKIQDIFYDFYSRELDCANGNEFDHEYMEAKTDDILRLIRRQGGIV